MVVVGKIVGAAIDLSKAIFEQIAVRAAPVLARLQTAIAAGRCGVNVAAHVHINLAAGCREDDAVFHADGAVEHLAIFITPIQLTAVVDKAVAKPGEQTGLLVKMVPGDILDVSCDGECIAVCHIAVHIQPVGALLQGDKAAEPGLARPEILGALSVGAERAAHQLAVVGKGIGQAVHVAHTGVHGVVRAVEEIEVRLAVLCEDRLPAGNHRAHSGIIAFSFEVADTGQLAVAVALLAKVIPEGPLLAIDKARQLPDAGEGCAVFIVAPAVVLQLPAVLAGIVQPIRVVKAQNVVCKVGAIVAGDVLAVVIGIQAVFFLIFRLFSQALQNVEVRIDVIVQLSGQRHVQRLLLAPGSVGGGGQLEAAEHADRIGRGRIDRLRLGDEVALHHQCVAHDLFGGQGQILVGQPQVLHIRLEALRDLDRNGNGGQRTDPLCKLEHEIPGSASLLIAAGQHVQQACQLFGNWHLGHINGKGVGCLHGLLRIPDVVGLLLLFIVGVGNLAPPRQQAVAAGGVVEVKGSLVCAVKVDRRFRRCFKRFADGSSLRHQSSLLIAQAFRLRLLIGLGEFLADQCLKLAELAFEHRADRKGADGAVGCRGKIEVCDDAGLGILKDELGLGGVNGAAFDVADGLQADFEEAELDVIWIDFHNVAVVGRLHRQIGWLPEHRIDGLFGKFQICGHDNVKRFGAQDLPFCAHKLDLHISHCCGSENALF